MNNIYNSGAKQDEFVANMLQFKRGGYFLDIGSAESIDSNNTYFFESLNWNGICIELDSKYNNMYNNRNCNFINGNALDINYKELFKEKNAPKEIDYLSLDVDTLSYDVLLKLPFDEYKFKTITIEHDFYLHGDVYKKKQKEFLKNEGYFLLCEDVYVPHPTHANPNCPFEDWWILPEFFDKDLIENILSKSEYPIDIIKKFV